MTTYALFNQGTLVAISTVSPWTGTPTMATLFHPNGEQIVYDTAKCHHDFKSFEEVTKYADFATEYFGEVWLPIESNNRFNFIKAPKVGEDVSYGFNGDFYHCGKITRITKSWIVIVEDSEGHITRFRRKKNTGAWVKEGGTWCMVPGIINKLNPEF